ncbi:LacI family transcriptional regulator [Acidaminobacter sp. JC074]|uniref:LacI family DNA-binding transcriptional regulator n=1 Tax=Acidaminobacter sp. JC074 TaxID=2530199 RepID=UPI001F0E1FD9|nr:LacI family DNA-binding transcriptional regulator [Acidaminobacter sp. JC074]MCH4886575.1 LacI family transcriptional regulator [Acidaminobacter sp. JC074]
MSTIKKVAKEAGVSTATVSRVLNGNYPVSKDAYEKVMAAVKKTGYKGNAIAKSLKMNKTFMIGLVVPDISNSYFMEIAKGIENIITSKGYTLMICSTEDDPEKEDKVLQTLHNKRVDAVILATCQSSGKSIKEFIDDGLKIIMIDSKIEGLDVSFVGEENFKNTVDLIEYCISKGHRSLGIIKGVHAMETARTRMAAFAATLSKHGLPLKDDYVIEGGYHAEIAFEAVGKLLQKDYPSLLFASNNKMAEGAMRAIFEAGLKIPDDISLVAYGDISTPHLIKPSLTVIEQNPLAFGIKTGELLLELLNKDFISVIKHEVKFKEGQSVKSL